MLSLGIDQSPSHPDQEEKDTHLSLEPLVGCTGETVSLLFGYELRKDLSSRKVDNCGTVVRKASLAS
jgi:hypothetical protein